MDNQLGVALQIGGVRAPSPVGELGNVEMTQAITLVDSSWQVVGPDVLLTGANLHLQTCAVLDHHNVIEMPKSLDVQ